MLHKSNKKGHNEETTKKQINIHVMPKALGRNTREGFTRGKGEYTIWQQGHAMVQVAEGENICSGKEP